MIHFAAVRSYSKDGLYHLLLETQVNVGFRDELYRTARDVAEQANIRENVDEIDRYVVYLAARGKKNDIFSADAHSRGNEGRYDVCFFNLTRRRNGKIGRASVGGLRSHLGCRGRRGEHHRHRRGKGPRSYRAIPAIDP